MDEVNAEGVVAKLRGPGMLCPPLLEDLASHIRRHTRNRHHSASANSPISPLLKRLEAGGLIRRERRADDERSVAIHLTDAGAELQDKARNIPLAIGEAMALDTEQDAAAKHLLRLLIANITGR